MSEKKKRKQPAPMRMQNVFIFLLLAIFAISAIFLTALSAQVYRDTVDTANRNNTSRIVSAVIRGAAQSEDAGAASVREEGGCQVLVFTTEEDGERYYHRIYASGGYLREVLSSENREFEDEMGDPLVEVTSFEPKIEGNTLYARIGMPDGREEEVYVYLRAGGAAE